MNEKEIENYKKIFNQYTEISSSENESESGKESSYLTLKAKPIKQKKNESPKGFGDFVLMMDNKAEYKKMVLDNAKKKIWKVINKIKNNKGKDLSKIIKDPSKIKWYIINPVQNKYKTIFDSIFYLLLYIDFLFTPYEYLIYQGSYQYYRIMAFDIFFAIEILSHFFIAYYDVNNKFYVTDLKKICINYIKGEFFICLFYVLPLYLIYSTLEIFRLIKLYKYPTVNNQIKRLATWLLSFIIKNNAICSQIVRIFTFFLSICYITHMCACIYCFLGLRFDDSWIYFHSDLLDTDSYSDIYISSYYFIIETLSSTGYGDLTPNNYAEILFIMFCQIFTCGLYAYLLSNILDILLNKDNSESYKYRASQIDLENFIMYYMKKLPASSKNDNLHRNKIWGETKKYYELYYNPTKNLNWIKDKNFIEQMKPSHRNELMLTVFEPILNKFFLFFNKIKLNSSKIKIIMNLKTTIQVAKTELNFPWKKMHKIYFIDHGSVDIYLNRTLWNTLNEGYYFGIENILKMENIGYEYITYKVSEDCPYAIFYTIDIPFLINEILNYDLDSFQNMVYLASNYIKTIIKKENNNNKNLIMDEEEEINTGSKDNINNDNNIIYDDKLKQSKLNLDLINPGCLPDLDYKIEAYKKAEKVVDESNLKVELMEKQIDFINKYMDKIKKNNNL